MKYLLAAMVIALMLLSMNAWLAPLPEADIPEHVVYEPPPELEPLPPDPEPEPEPQQGDEPDEPILPGDLPAYIEQQVPFTPQAPLAQWGDPRYADACEESSVWMAALWADGDTREAIDGVLATQELARLSDVSVDLFDTFVDTSAQDTLWMLRSEVPGISAEIIESPDILDMKLALASGAIILAPTDGRALANPNFTPPGPERHMVVVTGYDDSTGQFITNDPGTRNGNGFRYGYEHFMIAIRDYVTGNRLPITTLEKRVIVVRKSPDSDATEENATVNP